MCRFLRHTPKPIGWFGVPLSAAYTQTYRMVWCAAFCGNKKAELTHSQFG
jgi:hypothetical protein